MSKLVNYIHYSVKRTWLGSNNVPHRADFSSSSFYYVGLFLLSVLSLSFDSSLSSSSSRSPSISSSMSSSSSSSSFCKLVSLKLSWAFVFFLHGDTFYYTTSFFWLRSIVLSLLYLDLMSSSMAAWLAYYSTYCFILSLYFCSYLIWSWAASGFSGSDGFGYSKSYGRKTSKMLMRSYIGDHVWLMTSRHTDPELEYEKRWVQLILFYLRLINIWMKNPVLETNWRWFIWV